MCASKCRRARQLAAWCHGWVLRTSRLPRRCSFSCLRSLEWPPTAWARDTCQRLQANPAAATSTRYLKKRESRVDGDQADTIGLSFKFDVLGGAVDVAAAVRAANHFPYERSSAYVFRSRVWLNYGSGDVVPSTCECGIRGLISMWLCSHGCCLCGCVVQCATQHVRRAWTAARTRA